MTLDNKSYLYLRDCLGNIAEELQPTFTEAERSAVFEFIDVGEYGLAFDSICSIVLEKNITISREIYDRLSELGKLMELNPDTWTKLKPPASRPPVR